MSLTIEGEREREQPNEKENNLIEIVHKISFLSDYWAYYANHYGNSKTCSSLLTMSIVLSCSSRIYMTSEVYIEQVQFLIKLLLY